MAYLSISSVSYEGSLFGWDLVPARLKSSDGSGESEEFIQCKVTYAFNLTPNSLKCVAISPSGNYLICAGMDEYIRVFDLKKKKSIGDMSGHTGCVTALSFVGNDYIMSASEDCTIIIWSVKNWKKMHILGGHKNTINDFTVHPSGKLAASVSKDNTMKIWNLVHGRCAFTRRLRGPADKIIWHSTQEKYAMVVGNELQIFASTDNNTCTASITYKSRINAVAFVDLGMPADTDNSEIYVAVVCENRSLMIVTDDGTELCKHDMSDLLQQSRPKDIVSTRISLDDVAATSGESVMDTDSDSLVIISSKGHVVVLNAIALISGSDDHDEETDAINEKKKKIGENSIDYAVQAIDQIAVEPRLTAVSGWSLAHQGLVLDEALVDSAEEAVESSADKGSKGSKKGRNNAVSKQDNEASFDKETGGDKKKKKKKKMKKRDAGDSDGESPGGSKKKKVHFANH